MKKRKKAVKPFMVLLLFENYEYTIKIVVIRYFLAKLPRSLNFVKGIKNQTGTLAQELSRYYDC